MHLALSDQGAKSTARPKDASAASPDNQLLVRSQSFERFVHVGQDIF
jgi:hypothetical protein